MGGKECGRGGGVGVKRINSKLTSLLGFQEAVCVYSLSNLQTINPQDLPLGHKFSLLTHMHALVKQLKLSICTESEIAHWHSKVN